MAAPCPLCGYPLRKRYNMTKVTPEGIRSLMRCTNKICRHHVYRLSGKDSFLPLESDIRFERFSVSASDLILTPPPGVN